MTTVSELLAAAEAVEEAGTAVEAENRGAGTRARARAKAMVTVRNDQWVARARDWMVESVGEYRHWWWTPQSLPTITRAWRDRLPPHDRVPGGHKILYGAWVGWNHTIGLAVPVAAAALVGVISTVAWMLAHPARGLLTLTLLAAALAALV